MSTTKEQTLENRPPVETSRLTDVGILALVPEPWYCDLWLGRHQVLPRLARYFNVVWCDPPRGWRELWFQKPWSDPDNAHREPPEQGFALYTQSQWLPKMYKPGWLARLTARKRFAAARDRLIAMGSRKIALYMWRPEFADALDLADHDVSCYHIADEYTFSTTEAPIGEREAELIRRADQVLIHSPALLEKKGHLNPNTLHVTNGVDFAHFSAPFAEPDDMRAIPHPRIGYVGRIKIQLDWDLIHGLATAHPEWSFVFVGPLSNTRERGPFIEALFRMPNVHYLGAKPVDQIPGYIQHLDVCTLPYVLDDYTKYIYPLKLHEYLAGGRPVVGSPIRSLAEFKAIVPTATSVGEWSDAISRCLADEANSAQAVERRQAIAREHDWDRLVDLIARALCKHLGPEYMQQLEAIQASQSNGDRR